MFYIIIAALLWSLDGLLRQSLYSLPPAVVVFWEHVLGAVFLLFVLVRKYRELGKMTKKEWISIILVSCFSGALGTIFYTAALGKVNYIQFSVVVLLQQLQPIWAISTAALLLREKITKRFLLWSSLAIIASYFVTFRDLRINLTTESGTLIAALLALGAGMMWAVSTSLSKITLKKVSFELATFLRFLIAPAFALLFIVGFGQTGKVVAITLPQWITLLTITFSTGMVALLIYYKGLKHTPAKLSAICELVWPVSAIIIDYVYFHRPLTLIQLAAAGVVLFSILQVAKEKR